MQEGEVVFKGKAKKGTEIIIRYPTEKDLSFLLLYINTLSKEKTFISFQGEQMSIEQEKNYLDGRLSKIKNNESVYLLVFIGEKLIGDCHITLEEKISGHVGDFGISIAKEFRNEGIGKLLINLIFEEAKKNIKKLKIVKLGAFANNPIAISMYKKIGFVEYGRLPDGILYKGKFIDHVYMYKKI